MRMFLPIRSVFFNEEKSSHWVLVTLVPGSSSGPSSETSFSYRDSPIAWIGIFGEPGFLRNELYVKIRLGM